MYLLIAAIVMAILATLSGILAVGSGRHWQFGFRDYFRGRRDAILYLWVISSTIFSTCHAGVLIEFAFFSDWSIENARVAKWLVIHTTVGFLFTIAHAMVWASLRKTGLGPVASLGDMPTDYLWGKRKTT